MKQEGFTLVELLVASAIFVLLVVGITQLYANALNLQRRAAGIEHIEESAQLVYESISRLLRVGVVTAPVSDNTGSCAAGPSASNNSITIQYPDPVSGVTVTSVFAYNSASKYITRSDNGGAAQPITSSDAAVTKAMFCVANAGSSTAQVRVTMPMTMQATVTKGGATVSVSVQTTVAGRAIH